jgi:hypothetical protein
MIDDQLGHTDPEDGLMGIYLTRLSALEQSVKDHQDHLFSVTRRMDSVERRVEALERRNEWVVSTYEKNCILKGLADLFPDSPAPAQAGDLSLRPDSSRPTTPNDAKRQAPEGAEKP